MFLLNSRDFFIKFWNDLILRIQRPEIIIALCLLCLGVTFAILSKRLARMFKGKNEISNDDSALIVFKFLSLALVFVAVLIIVFVSI